LPEAGSLEKEAWVVPPELERRLDRLEDLARRIGELSDVCVAIDKVRFAASFVGDRR